MFSSAECLAPLLRCMHPNSIFFMFTDCSHLIFFFITHVQDNIDSKSDFDDDNKSASGFSVVSNFDNIEPLGDISPDAL